jgi:hypothetical protein
MISRFQFLLFLALYNCSSVLAQIEFAGKKYDLIQSIDSNLKSYEQYQSYLDFHSNLVGYYQFEGTGKIVCILDQDSSEQNGFYLLFYPDGNLCSFKRYEPNKIQRYFEFDKQNLPSRLVVYQNKSIIYEYTIKNWRMTSYSNHRAKRGTKKSQCNKKLPLEDRAIFEWLISNSPNKS